MKNILNARSINTDMATLVLRILFGGLFVYYGYGKINMYDMIAPNFPNYTGLGKEGSYILVIFAEFVCGFLVLIGLLTRLAIIPIFITMLVAFFVAHANDPFDVKQIAFVYLILCIVIFFLGSGKYSIDQRLFRSGE